MNNQEILNALIDILKITETKPMLNEISGLIKMLVANKEDYSLILAKKLVKLLNYEYVVVIKPALINIVESMIEVL